MKMFNVLSVEKYQEEKKSFLGKAQKGIKKVAVGVGVGLMLFGGVFNPVEVVAYNASGSNAHINVYLTASRPLIGNPRGSTMVSTNTASSHGLRFRTRVHNTNGTISTAPINRNGVGSDGWSTQLLSSGTFSIGVCPIIQSVTVTGATRGGTVTGYGARRSTATNGVNSWNNQLAVSLAW